MPATKRIQPLIVNPEPPFEQQGLFWRFPGYAALAGAAVEILTEEFGPNDLGLDPRASTRTRRAQQILRAANDTIFGTAAFTDATDYDPAGAAAAAQIASQPRNDSLTSLASQTTFGMYALVAVKTWGRVTISTGLQLVFSGDHTSASLSVPNGGITTALLGALSVTTAKLANGAVTLAKVTSDIGVTALGLSQFAATTSAELAGVISDETGSGKLVFATSPTLVTPILGTPTSGNLANCTNANLTGPVTSVGNATTIATGVVTEAMQILADNTTANASTSAHGYLKKLDNNATHCMDGTGAWSVPSALTLTGIATPSATGGQVFYDTTRKTIGFGVGALATPINAWAVGVLFAATASASNTTTAQSASMVGTGVGTMTFPANMPGVGCTLRLRATGVVTSGATTGNITWLISFGIVQVAASPAQGIQASLTNRFWSMDCDITFRAVGASGSVFAQGVVFVQGTLTTALNIISIRGNAADPPAVVTVDTTASTLIDFITTTSNANNTITCNTFTLERLI